MAATLILDVVTNTAKAVSGLKGLSGATDEAARTSEKHKSALGGVASTAAKVAGAAALGGLVMMLKTGVGEQKDYLAGQAQLEAGLKSTGNAANTSVKSMEGLASSIQDYSGQTDDSIVAAEQLMLTFTGVSNAAGKNNDVFDQSIKMTADMAARMGGDASKYAVLLGKALNDPAKGLTALTRIGVSFTEGQKKQIKSMQTAGNTMGAQKIILGELQREFGGSAKAAGDTLPGQMKRAQRSFEDISQALVGALLPAINALMPAFMAVTRFISNNTGLTFALAGGIVALVAAYKVWQFWTVTLTAANRALAISLATNPVFLIIAAIVALVAILVIAYKKVGWFRDMVNAAFHAVAAIVAWCVSFVRNNWQKILIILTGPVGIAVALIVRYWSQIVGGVRSMIGGIRSALATVVSIITTPFSRAWNWISTNVIGPMSRMFTGVVGAIGRALSGVTNAITAPFEAAWNWIRDHVVSPLKSAWNSVANVINGIHFEITVPSNPITKFAHIAGKGWTFDPPNIPTLASGGYATRATAAIIGERGPEIVAPEPMLRSIIRDELRNGSGIVVNVSGALDPDAVARQIERILRNRAQRVRGVNRRGGLPVGA